MLYSDGFRRIARDSLNGRWATAVGTGLVAGLLIIILIWSVICFVVGGAVTLGYAKFNLKLVARGSQYQLGQGFTVLFFVILLCYITKVIFSCKYIHIIESRNEIYDYL